MSGYYSPQTRGTLTIKSNGITLAESASELDFTGAGQTGSAMGGVVTIDISGSGGGGGSGVFNEVLSGTIDGVNNVFTFSQTPVVGSTLLYVGGARQELGLGDDYTVSGNTATLTVAPTMGPVIADYSLDLTALSNNPFLLTNPTTVDFTVMGNTTIYTIPHGKTLLITQIIGLVTDLTGFIDNPTIQVDATAVNAEGTFSWLASTMVILGNTGLPGSYNIFLPTTNPNPLADQDTDVVVNVTAPSTSDSFKADFYLYGFLIG